MAYVFPSRAPALPRRPARLVVKESPLNAEAPPAALATALTPARAHFVRSHFAVPSLDPRAHRIAVEGAVAAPAGLSLAELTAGPCRDITVTLECAGNGRSAMAPLP